MSTSLPSISHYRRIGVAAACAALVSLVDAQSTSTSPPAGGAGSGTPPTTGSSPGIPAIASPTGWSPSTFWQAPANTASSIYSTLAIPGYYSRGMADPVFELSELRRRWNEYHGPALSFGVFLPLTPPALAQSLDSAELRIASRAYPRELLQYVGEPFYMAFASLHKSRVLYRGQERRVESYRADRDAAAAELRAELDRRSTRPAGERASTLTPFAAPEEARLQAIEAEAEAIRDALTGTSLLHATNDGGMLRSWRDLTRREPGPISEYMGLLLAAEFQDGLSPEQRALLHEIALQLRIEARANRSGESDASAAPLWFLPFTARIRLPAELPAPVRSQVEAFTALKAALARELRAVVAEDDQFFFVGQRTQKYRALAQQQAPRFAELERLAEQIRVGLAPLPHPDEPPRSELPAELTRRVGELVAGKTALRRAVATRLRELQAALPDHKVELVRQRDSVALVVTTRAGAPAGVEHPLGSPAALAEFNAETARKYRTLAGETDALRRDIQRYADTQPRSERTVEEWAAAFNTSHAAQENWNRYRDYRRAVLEPGLSPAQRRLLYRTAVIELVTSANAPAS